MGDKMFGLDLAFYVGVCVGVISRIIMLNTDQNQYPTHPNILVSQLILSFVASALGALLVPALVARSYTSITFLALAAEQFRQVRANRRNTLQNIEPLQLVQRGGAFIEEIARAYEVRNYMCIITSFMAVAIDRVMIDEFHLGTITSLAIGGSSGIVLAIILKKLLTRQSISDIADVVEVPISFVDGSILKVGDLDGITNIGLKSDRDVYLKRGIGIEVIPKERDYKNAGILYNSGQRQAILYNIYARLGRAGDLDDIVYTPLARRNPKNESLVFAFVPTYGNARDVIEAVKSAPIIESAKGKNLSLQKHKIGSLNK
ncbi:MAG: YIEGIA family protein [Clostridioides sp.]|nr:YIEGIA family protein [Clostridioides sp.]